jgi:hypothetical protein
MPLVVGVLGSVVLIGVGGVVFVARDKLPAGSITLRVSGVAMIGLGLLLFVWALISALSYSYN